MLSRKRKNGGGNSHPQQGHKPIRDGYDWLVLAIEFFALAGLILTVIYSCKQSKTATAALQNQQTPHVRLWFEDKLLGFDEGVTVQADGHIADTGQVTLYNAKVYAAINAVKKGQQDKIAGQMSLALDNLTMGPGDDELFKMRLPRRLVPEEYALIRSGKGVVVAILGIEYPDPAKRVHHRYVCNYWWWDGEKMVSEGCNTPPQD